MNKVLGPIKGKCDPRKVIYAERSPQNSNKNAMISARKNMNKSMNRNKFRNSGNPFDLNALDQWSNDIISKERLNETLKSDENNFETNFPLLRGSNELVQQTLNSINNSSNEGGIFLPADMDNSGYGAIHHEQFIKTSNSFYNHEVQKNQPNTKKILNP